MNKRLFQLSLVLAPGIFAASSFFWLPDGSYGVTGGLLQMFADVFWLVLFFGIFERLKSAMPKYAAIGLVLSVYGCICGGAAFAMQGIFLEVFHIDHHTMLTSLANYPVMTNIIFSSGGPAFPISLIILGIILSYKKLVPIWCGLLITLSGICFPVSRIPRIELVAHLADILMLLPLWYLAWWVNSPRDSVLLSHDDEYVHA